MKPLVVQADVMQRELESCLRREYTEENLPLLLHQVFSLCCSRSGIVFQHACPMVTDTVSHLKEGLHETTSMKMVC